MSSPTVSAAEIADGTFAQAFIDIACVLAMSDHPDARIARSLELLRTVVPYQYCALLIDTPPHRPRLTTVPDSHPHADRLRVRLHRLLQTVRERFDQASGTEPYGLTDMPADGRSLAVPLVTVDAVIGILNVGRDTEYSIHELRRLAVVASQFAAYVRGLQFLEQAAQARAQAEEANRAKDRFLATLSHEMRTPLNVVQGWLHMLRAGQAGEAELPKAMDVIERNVCLQIQLVDQLLDAARVATGKFHVDVRPVEIVSIVSATVDATRPMAQDKGVDLDCHVSPPGTWTVQGDPARLQQTFSNLLVNAVKFTPTGGSVRVSIEADGPDVVIMFQDTGIGIAREDLSRLFDRLWQGDTAVNQGQGGLGLGLSIVHHIVQLHHGEVRAQSEGPGRGTTFVVRLPVSC
jgi:signal transduction histidine kinase